MPIGTPWYTSDDLIAAVQRKISFPIAQNTFSNDDILQFANEEMMISQVPSILQYHQEYFVTTIAYPLLTNQTHYPVPNRAIGMRIRDIYWQDQNGNLFDMTRVDEKDRAFFQKNVGANQAIHKYFFEGNDIVLTPNPYLNPTGSLFIAYFLRPNQLVSTTRAAIIQSFVQMVTVSNTGLLDGDTITINDVVFTARTSPTLVTEFQIGINSVVTATNLVNTVNTNGIALAANGSPSTFNVTFDFLSPVFSVTTSNTAAFVIPLTEGVRFNSIPANITNGSLVDFLQTQSGHRTYSFDVQVPLSGISGNVIYFNDGDVPPNCVVGDYISTANECIIPQIPTELHNGLAERTCARILEAIGDQQGAQMVATKLSDINQVQGTLIDNRAEGTPLKLNARHAISRFLKMGVRRRF